MEKKLLFIYNPRAGKTGYTSHLTEIFRVFIDAGYRVEVFPTGERGDGREYARGIGDDFDLVVAAGGDGTLNEIVGGLRESHPDLPIGYLPVGSTNDFASSLGIPQNPVQAAKNILSKHLARVDLGRFGSDYFVYVAAFGLFTNVAYETDQTLKNLFGHAAYLISGVKSLGELRTYRMTIRANGETKTDDYILGMITNSISVGGFKNITGRDVALSDGLFEVTLVKAPKNGLADLSDAAAALIAGNENIPLLEVFKTDRIEIAGEDNVPWTLDGEFGGNHQNVVIENLQYGLQLYC